MSALLKAEVEDQTSFANPPPVPGPKTIVFDLDGVICMPAPSDDPLVRYGRAAPNKKVIETIRKLSTNEAFRIEIFTSRAMEAWNNNVAKAYNEIHDTTLEWLKRHNVPYHALRFGRWAYDECVSANGMDPDQFLRLYA